MAHYPFLSPLFLLLLMTMSTASHPSASSTVASLTVALDAGNAPLSMQNLKSRMAREPMSLSETIEVLNNAFAILQPLRKRDAKSSQFFVQVYQFCRYLLDHSPHFGDSSSKSHSASPAPDRKPLPLEKHPGFHILELPRPQGLARQNPIWYKMALELFERIPFEAKQNQKLFLHLLQNDHPAAFKDALKAGIVTPPDEAFLNKTILDLLKKSYGKKGSETISDRGYKKMPVGEHRLFSQESSAPNLKEWKAAFVFSKSLDAYFKTDLARPSLTPQQAIDYLKVAISHHCSREVTQWLWGASASEIKPSDYSLFALLGSKRFKGESVYDNNHSLLREYSCRPMGFILKQPDWDPAELKEMAYFLCKDSLAKRNSSLFLTAAPYCDITPLYSEVEEKLGGSFIAQLEKLSLQRLVTQTMKAKVPDPRSETSGLSGLGPESSEIPPAPPEKKGPRRL